MRTYSSVVAALMAGTMLASCASAPASIPSRPLVASKSTCAELVPSGPGNTFELLDRNLVPYSRELLTVIADYEAAGATGAILTLISGGSLDDHIEAYDDLAAGDAIDLSDGLVAEVQSGLFYGQPVHVATWRAQNVPSGCEQRAVIAVGMDELDFRRMTIGLTLRSVGDNEE